MNKLIANLTDDKLDPLASNQNWCTAVCNKKGQNAQNIIYAFCFEYMFLICSSYCFSECVPSSGAEDEAYKKKKEV